MLKSNESSGRYLKNLNIEKFEFKSRYLDFNENEIFESNMVEYETDREF